ncbi:C4-dicarboxylate TRAP transporter substrate-binding protein [Marinospirillum alkaliphilum]|nr:C4-dicarboxylate TRAP transporter substrate-binding protein [Marinospirillum alkaliphilum]
MKKIKILFTAVAVSLMTLLVYPQLAVAQQLRIASGLPPMQPANNPLYTEFQKRLPEATSGRLSAQMVGMEVVNLANMRSGLNSGLVQVGLFLPAYFPADLPNFNLVGDLSLMGGHPQATAAAMTEYIVTCSDCQQELKRLGVVYTGSHANPYSLLTTRTVRSTDDLRGMRIRVATPQHARWVEAMGATPVSMPTGEAFEALSQGIIEGTVTSISDLISFNLQDVIKSVTLLDMGTFHSLIDHAIRQNTWNSLSVEDRKAMISVSNTAILMTVDRWIEMAGEGRAVAEKRNIPLVEPDTALVQATRGFVAQDVSVAVNQAETRFRVTDAAQKIARFQQLMSKWEARVAELNHDAEAVHQALQHEVWDKIDLAAYGR